MSGPLKRVLIVDDEPLARLGVSRQLAKILPDAELREAQDGLEALEQVKVWSPELVTLDIEMPELSGLDVLRQLAAPRPKIIFVTAFDSFAVAAFELHACDYVVKPFAPERLRAAVERAAAERETERKLRALEDGLSRGGQWLDRLAFRTGARVEVVPVAQIACFRSEGHYTYAQSGKDEHLTELSLDHLTERLDPAVFVRVHRAALVSLAHVERLTLGPPARVELRNGTALEVSRRSLGALKRALGM